MYARFDTVYICTRTFRLRVRAYMDRCLPKNVWLKMTLQTAQKPKGDRWMKKYFFQKCSLVFFNCEPINCIFCVDSINIHIKGLVASKLVHAVQSVHRA